MKVGDKKQAISLGVVAVFAVGMLGKTALGSFSKGNDNQPIVVKDIGSPPPRTGTSIQNMTSQSSQPETNATDNKLSSDNSTVIKRDAFEKPDLPEKTKSFGYPKQSSGSERESYRPTYQIPPEDPQYSTTEPLKGSLPGASEQKKSDENSNPKTDASPKVDRPSIRFDGFVEAGSPMGIVSVEGNSFSVSIGDAVGSGYRVESISSQKITIRKGKTVKTIYIGQETNF